MKFWQRLRRCAQAVLAILAVIALLVFLGTPGPQEGRPRGGTTGL